jgi:hypothetical protein
MRRRVQFDSGGMLSLAREFSKVHDAVKRAFKMISVGNQGSISLQ